VGAEAPSYEGHDADRALVQAGREAGMSIPKIIKELQRKGVKLDPEVMEELYYLSKLSGEEQAFVARVEVDKAHESVRYMDDDGNVLREVTPDDTTGERDMIIMDPYNWLPLPKGAMVGGGLLRRGARGIAERLARMGARAAAKEALEVAGNVLTRMAKGEIGEQAARKTLQRLGYELMKSKLPGNRGLDGVFVKRGALGEVLDIIIAESKYSSSGKALLNETKTMGKQMSDRWIRANIDKMLSSTDGAVRATGRLLDRYLAMVKRKVNIFDGTLNRWNKVSLPD
jgi:hypothetical protein